MGSSPSFWTPNFLSGAFGKGFNFMIASDHKLILRFFWWSEKMQLWSRAIIKLKHFSGVPDKKLGVENDGLDPTKLFTRPKIRKSFFSVMDFCKTFWEISDFFIISHILTFWKMLFRSLKKVCDEVSKIKNLRCTFFSFFRARRHGIWLFSNIHTCLAANWGRKWSVFGFWKKSKISQNVLQKSTTEKNDFLIFGRVKSFVGPSPSFCTPNFLSGGSEKCFTFMIASDHKLIFSDHLP